MPHRFDPQNLHKLDNPERRQVLPPELVLKHLQLKKGHTLLDIGAGTGYFSIPATQLVGETGQVIASDISAVMLHELSLRVPEGTKNLVTILTENEILPLPDASVNTVLMAFVFHEIGNKEQILDEISRVLCTDGTLAVVEWIKTDSPMGPPSAERLAPEETTDHCLGRGFTYIRTVLLNPFHYLLIFKK
jgi:ubiquinone/menaquinone biosynthesis C-methylase UbiE